MHDPPVAHYTTQWILRINRISDRVTFNLQSAKRFERLFELCACALVIRRCRRD